MKSIKNIISILNPDTVVSSDVHVDDIHIDKNISDARSAAFYAFGNSKISNRNTVLLIKGDYLPNVYTVLTEAWFQKTNFIVIAIYKSIYNVETHYLNRCLKSNITLQSKDFELFKKKIEKSNDIIGPKLINVVVENTEENNTNDYKKEIDVFADLYGKDDTIYAYNSKSSCETVRFCNIDEKYKYGIISKYLAYTTESKFKSVLICTADCLKVDLNILNSKNMNSNFKVVVKGDIDKEIKWIESNNIKYMKAEDLSKDIKYMIETDEPIILNVKEEK